MILTVGLVSISNINALEVKNVEPRLSVFDSTIEKSIPIRNASGSTIGKIKTYVTATIRNVNGVYSIDSYTLKADKVDLGLGDNATATVYDKSKSGMSIKVIWLVTTNLSHQIVTDLQTMTYDFS